MNFQKMPRATKIPVGLKAVQHGADGAQVGPFFKGMYHRLTAFGREVVTKEAMRLRQALAAAGPLDPTPWPRLWATPRLNVATTQHPEIWLRNWAERVS